MTIELTDTLRDEYQTLFRTCEIRAEKRLTVEQLVRDILQNEARYRNVGAPLGVPWYFIGTIHAMETSLSFNKHLHNGDPLTGRTVHVPKGRPIVGNPPFTWEQSATDVLKMRNLEKVTDWSLAGLLFQVEAYNGFGYRKLDPPLPSPYLWSFSEFYTSGKFVADGKFDAGAVSQQCGAAVILNILVEQDTVQFDSRGNPLGEEDGTTVSPSIDADI